MNALIIFLIVSIMAILLIAIIFLKRNGWKKASPLTLLSLWFIFTGIVMGGSGSLIYGSIGLGVVISLIDIGLKLKKDNTI